MSRRATSAILTAVGLSIITATAQAATKGGYAYVNGINLYYEIYGTGQPLVLLHGGLGSIEMFGPSLPMLSASRQVIAVDLQAHGRTADIDRPLRFELMADVAILPGVTHYDIYRSPALWSTAIQFLDAPMPESK